MESSKSQLTVKEKRKYSMYFGAILIFALFAESVFEWLCKIFGL